MQKNASGFLDLSVSSLFFKWRKGQCPTKASIRDTEENLFPLASSDTDEDPLRVIFYCNVQKSLHDLINRQLWGAEFTTDMTAVKLELYQENNRSGTSLC